MADVHNIDLRPLHTNTYYIEACCEILNEEWPQNKQLRLDSLQESRDALPLSLILLENDCLVGHCRLSRVISLNDACFISSVVVWKSIRGRGYGRIIMKGAENYAAKLNFKKMYLTTHDRQKFYEKLGFSYCEPVIHSTHTSNALQMKIQKLLNNSRRSAKQYDDKDTKEHDPSQRPDPEYQQTSPHLFDIITFPEACVKKTTVSNTASSPVQLSSPTVNNDIGHVTPPKVTPPKVTPPKVTPPKVTPPKVTPPKVTLPPPCVIPPPPVTKQKPDDVISDKSDNSLRFNTSTQTWMVKAIS